MDTRRYDIAETTIPEREIYRPAPSRTMHDALVPGVRACIGGAFASLAIVALARIVGQTPRSLDGWIWLLFCSFALTSAGIWIWSERRQEIIYLAETVTQRDISGDGIIGATSSTIHPFVPNLAGEVRERENERMAKEQDAFQHYIDICYDLGTDMRTIVGQGIDAQDAVRYRQWAVSSGLLRWRSDTNRNLGTELVYADQLRANQIIARLQWTRGDGGTKPAPYPSMQ